MRAIGRGDRGPAVTEIRAILAGLDLLPENSRTGARTGGATPEPDPTGPAVAGNGTAPVVAGPVVAGPVVAGPVVAGPVVAGADPGRVVRMRSAIGSNEFDTETERAVRAFQQSRGLNVDGRVGPETWRALDAARWRLGARTLYQSVPSPLVGEDVRTLQERLLEMGFDVGRADGIYGARTARAVAQFQREVGLFPDGACGPQTMNALRRLGRKVVGGRPQLLREADAFRQSGPNLVGKVIIIDPGHDPFNPGVVVADGPLRWAEMDLTYDLASRLEGRLAAAGMRVHLTRGPAPEAGLSELARAELANELGGDLLISLHIDGHPNPAAQGVATYHYGTANGVTSTVGEHLAGLVQREMVVRTGLRDCRTHAKTWELLRFTRMPAVRVEVGYLTSPDDLARLTDPRFRDRVVDAIVAAVQRMYFPIDQDVPTGSIDVRELRAALASGARR